jgi:predicted ATPase
LRALRDQIRSGRRPEQKATRPGILPSPGSSIPPNNLPPDPTPLIGREDEIRRVSQLMADDRKRLVTIVGPGGIGKTRLALAAAGRELSKSNFPDGVYFVSLTPIAEPEAMMSLIAETVGYPLQTDRRSSAQQLFDYFRQKSLLLVLDNFEHLLAGTAFIADLMQQAAGITILATSRERLNLYEEQQFLLGGLAFPEDPPASEVTGYAAARLFLQSARGRRPDFEVAPADLPHLAAICHLVEGMPLGLEMAAAWTNVLSLREIAAEIRQTLDFLETDVRNVPERHRSMRAVFDASWQRLSKSDRPAYAHLSVFRGGFTAAAAQAVAGASLRGVAALVNQSLLRAHPGSGRYNMHELLRQYAASKIGESTAGEDIVRDRHAAYYCAFLNEREEDLKGARQQEALAELEADAENAIAAWKWAARRQQISRLEQALVPLALFYQWTGRLREGAAMCRLAVEHVRMQPSSTLEDGSRRVHLLLKLLTWHSLFELAAARYEIAEQSLAQARALVDDPRLDRRDTAADRAFLLLQLSAAAKIKAFGGDALALNEQSLALYRSIDDEWGVTLALFALGAKHQSLGNYGIAVELAQECLAVHRRLDNPRGIARAYSTLGHYILFDGNIESSERHLRKSLDLFRSMDSRADMRLPLLLLGINLQFGGKFEASIDSFEACWAIHRELGIPHEPGSANVGITRARIDLGCYEKARSLAESDLIRYQSLNHKWYVAFTLFNLGRIALAEGAIPQARRHLEESAALLLEMDDRPLVPDVRFCLARVHRQRADQPQAIQAMKEALGIALESAPLNPMRFELPAMALLALDGGDRERAVELYAAARQSPYIARSRWFEEIAGREIARAAADLAPDVAAAAEARGAARDLWSTALALYEELIKPKKNLRTFTD